MRHTNLVRSLRFIRSTLVLISVGAAISACDGIGDSGEASTGLPSSASGAITPSTNLVFAPAAALAAAPDPSSNFSELEIPAQSLSLEELQAQVFQPHCAGCHAGGGTSLPASLNFTSATDFYASTIGTESSEDPQLQLIAPGQSTNSYLVRKLEGTQSVGKQMPLQGGPLPPWMVTAVKRWIDSGAVY